MELWLEDMGFAVVAKFSVNAGEGEPSPSIASTRAAIGQTARFLWIWRTWWPSFQALCDPYYEHEQPIYEL